MENHAELRQQLSELSEEIRALSAKDDANDEDIQRLDAELLPKYTELEARTVKAEARAAEVARITATRATIVPGIDKSPAQINREDPLANDPSKMERSERRDNALRVLESRGKRLSKRQIDNASDLIERSDAKTSDIISQRLLLTEAPAYRSAFAKKMSNADVILSPEESEAVRRFQEFERRYEQRVASEGTASAGGYGVPVLIDPTIILTSGAAQAPILDLARVITITTNQWKGVSSAGFSWAYQAETAVVTDNTPVLQQPTIPVYAARGFIPYTLELEQDYPGFEDEMSRLLAQGYLNMVASGTMTGSGTNQPRGIFTAMAAQTSPPHIAVTTAGTISSADIRNVWGALPERFRPTATWIMSVTVENVVRALGNNLALADFTVNLAADGTGVLTGRPVVLTDYAPAMSSVTTTYSYSVVGDFNQGFLVVQRAGMTLELVPHLFDPSTGRPIGERGWFAFARHGYDIVDPNAFRLLANTTSG